MFLHDSQPIGTRRDLPNSMTLEELTSFFTLAKETLASIEKDGWLACGAEGLSDVQKKVYALYKTAGLPDSNVKGLANKTVIVLPETLESGTYKIVPVVPSIENVDKYLKANEQYWVRTDSMPSSNPLKWRNGTPREATVEGYKAMIETAITIKIP